MEWNSLYGNQASPPLGVPLIVTVANASKGGRLELRYPVFYEKSKDGAGYRWSWRYGDFDRELTPDTAKVTAFTMFPKVFTQTSI